jgi:hypothetical protein
MRDEEIGLQAELAAIQRFLGKSPNAGLGQALRLATSRDAGPEALMPYAALIAPPGNVPRSVIE